MSWADQPRSFSDCIAILNAYKVGIGMRKFMLEDTIICKHVTYSIHSVSCFFHSYVCTCTLHCYDIFANKP